MTMENKFKKAIRQMIETGEFEKIAKWSSRAKRRRVMRLKELLLENIDKVPVIPIVCSINVPEIWQDIVLIMMGMEDEEDGEEESLS